MSEIEENANQKPIEFASKPLTDALTSPQSLADAELEMSIFRDGRDFKASGKPVYTLTLRIGKYEFYGNALGAEDLLYVKDEEAGIAADSKAIAKLPADQQQAAAEALAARSVAKDKWIIDKALTGWHHPDWSTPVPFNEANREGVAKHVWSKLADDIVAKSWSGRASSDVAANF